MGQPEIYGLWAAALLTYISKACLICNSKTRFLAVVFSYICRANSYNVIFVNLIVGSLEDSNEVPDVLIAKYNRFVDGIFERINSILQKNYDPVNVELNGTKSNSKSNSNKK